MIRLPKAAVTGLAVLLIGGLGMSQGVSAEGVSRAELLAAQCNACHGMGGKGAKPNPSINGEDPADFLDLMTAFGSGEEPATIMGRHASGYTEAELKMLADYYANQ